MQFFLWAVSCLFVSHANALVDLPAVSKVVEAELSALPLSRYTANHATASTTLSTVFASATAHALDLKIEAAVSDPAYWLKDITHQGLAAFNSNPSGYVVFRNVKDYGVPGDGSTDDTAAINAAISAGGRCAPGSCQSSTVTPAIVYFPAGTYIVSTPIIPYYMTQLIGNANSLPVIKATAGFTGLGLIDGDPYQSSGNQGWTSTNVFYRQVRNLILDLTAIPAATAATGIHWPTAQATSLQNVQIIMTASSDSQQQGIFIENGSGGFMSDVTVTGGLYGANIGNQQFTMRNLVISNAIVGISQIWDWGWTYQGITISSCTTAFSMISGGSSAQNVGSVNIIDSTITGCSVFVDTVWTTSSSPATAGSLILENVVLNNVPTAVHGTSGTILAGTTGSMTITSWGQGHKYTPNGPTTWQGSFTPVSRPGALLASGTNRYYTKSKPQYGASPVASFVSIRSAGAKGDGSTDDTTAIQNAITSAASSGKIVFFDYGVYKVTNTIYIPPGSRIVGETYSVIMASGGPWSNKASPVPVIQVGKSGDSGSVEWSDMVVSTQGSCPGAVLIQWNLAAASGSGMWDVHTRIGGFKGSNLQVAQCPTGAAVSSSCMAAYMSIHITSTGTGAYIENCWFWTADHDLDDASSTRVSIYTGRGMLVEANTVWLYGTSVEHHALYQYQISNTHFIVAGFVQTETPYWQPVPNVRNQPYPTNSAINDPTYSSCLPGNCDALGLRILNSQNIFIYGAGLYSFFNNYDTTCSNAPSSGGTENCQSEIFSIEGSGTNNIWVYSLSTIGSQSMVVQDGTSLASWSDNINVYPDTISYFTFRAG
ncbi:glycoside hydrolase family 55 protein [Cenococcum geophilum 1.58]|uniref:glycoside hydrolase family 55 protein n=1 Tax=Cenococcum geophilum 1.58 TaxID=794803 RepID=UPI003590185B|nr:glycoside hydrolase family 55 protein [Cenococcum geophilum 1.58]